LIAEASQTPYVVNKSRKALDSSIAIRSAAGVELVVVAGPLETCGSDMIQCSEGTVADYGVPGAYVKLAEASE
jgi:hypothetical protein